MKTNVTSILVAVAALGLSGCYQKHLVLQAEAVSMTKTDAGGVKALKDAGEVEEKWCTGDEIVYQDGDPSRIGLADQVIYKAQDGGKRADFITGVRVFTDTNGCALLTGKLTKL